MSVADVTVPRAGRKATRGPRRFGAVGSGIRSSGAQAKPRGGLDDELLTLAEAAEIARCHVKTLVRSLPKTLIRQRAPGGPRYTWKSDLIGWINGEPEATAPTARRATRARPGRPGSLLKPGSGVA